MSVIEYGLNNVLFALLMSFRIGAFLRTLPFFSEVKVTFAIQILIPVSIAFLLAPTLSYDIMPIMSSSIATVVIAIGTEVLIGAFMGFSVNILFVLATMIGELAGMQAGFSLASIFDPNLGQISIMSLLMRNIFLLVLFMLNVHHSLFMMLSYSYETLPIGMPMLSISAAMPAVFKLFASMYLMAFRIVLPIIVIILLSHITMGVISITAPQMNIYFNAAITLNFVIALIFFAISFPTIFRFLSHALNSLNDYWRQVFLMIG